jgi:HEXXH motif-containing protein
LEIGPNFFDFEPNPDRAFAVDSRVRVGLAESLAAVFQALPETDGRAVERILTRIRSGAVSPAVFGLYTDLVEAIFADRLDRGLVLARELRAFDLAHSEVLQIATLRDDHLGEGQSARYARLLNNDPELRLELRPLPHAVFSAALARVNKSITLINAVLPNLAGEIRNLVRQIVLVESNDEDFGATTFQLWGALFLRLKPDWGRVEIAEALAHESAHALLFGLAMGQPLVRNEPETAYTSTFRSDPRSMDGVVHATYVLARMHYTVSQLLDSGLLSAEEELVAVEARQRSANRYFENWDVLDKDAEWTPEGESALSSARAYMAPQRRC